MFSFELVCDLISHCVLSDKWNSRLDKSKKTLTFAFFQTLLVQYFVQLSLKFDSIYSSKLMKMSWNKSEVCFIQSWFLIFHIWHMVDQIRIHFHTEMIESCFWNRNRQRFSPTAEFKMPFWPSSVSILCACEWKCECMYVCMYVLMYVRVGLHVCAYILI